MRIALALLVGLSVGIAVLVGCGASHPAPGPGPEFQPGLSSEMAGSCLLLEGNICLELGSSTWTASSAEEHCATGLEGIYSSGTCPSAEEAGTCLLSDEDQVVHFSSDVALEKAKGLCEEIGGAWTAEEVPRAFAGSCTTESSEEPSRVCEEFSGSSYGADGVARDCHSESETLGRTYSASRCDPTDFVGVCVLARDGPDESMRYYYPPVEKADAVGQCQSAGGTWTTGSCTANWIGSNGFYSECMEVSGVSSEGSARVCEGWGAFSAGPCSTEGLLATCAIEDDRFEDDTRYYYYLTADLEALQKSCLSTGGIWALRG